jgi:hypothetical protein
MKKLLALILCVMMFVSVMSTAAFAAVPNPAKQRKWEGSQAQDVVEALRTNVQNMYGSMAADHVVFDTMKSTNSMINDLIDEALKEYSPNAKGTNTPKNTIRDAMRAGIKSAVGGTMAEYINDHVNDFTTNDKFGNTVFDPIKYATVYGQALSKALSSKDAVNGIQAYMMYGLQRSAYEKLANEAEILRTRVAGESFWKDYGFTDYSTGVAGSATTWFVPGTANTVLGNWTPDQTGILHNVNDTYHEYLNVNGLLGADTAHDDFITSGETAVTALTGEVLPAAFPWPAGTR